MAFRCAIRNSKFEDLIQLTLIFYSLYSFFCAFVQGEGGRIIIFLIVQVHFIFCWVNFIVLFTYLRIYYVIMFIIIVFRLGSDRLSGLLFFVPALRSIFTPLFLPSSSVSLSNFILAVPMREWSVGENTRA